MPTPLENELGLGPVMHRVRRWSRTKLSRIGMGSVPEDCRSLDPLTVNYETWREVRRTVREWPHYKEAANSIEVLVSPEDWEDYWGIDAARKEAGVAAYVRARAADKGYWIAGDPQVIVEQDDTIEPGEVEVVCQFVEPAEGEGPTPASNTAEHPVLDAGVSAREAALTSPLPEEPSQDRVSSTIRFMDPKTAGEACLTDEHGFRLVLKSGDCIGAVQEGDEEGCFPAEVNVRLDGAGFPYVAPKQCQLGVVGGRWTVTNFSDHGTMLVTAEGARLMLGEPEPYPIAEGDVLYLGPERPLRFELVEGNRT